ncbi:pirin family protein [Paraferrimonas sp. SM1919]|uniref:pirin family protein n=1 Tax=Paraferrimonas sp. SM1919 TaxID=2662263 RepID=UPI0013CF4E7C|nr:pirin family protein [Paraferrimonas sp. SM1919]
MRSIDKIAAGRPTSDGAGVKLTRIIGTPELDVVNPFLMLDCFETTNPDDYIGGFPSHPHRGFQTVTYMLAGRMRHQDNQGNEGLIEAGDVQWMNAGRGIIHSEMPEQRDGLMKGFQLWLNLPSHLKMSTPGYQEVKSADFPVIEDDSGNTIKLIAGKQNGYTGKISGYQDPHFMDISIKGASSINIDLPDSHGGFVYVIEGEANIAGAVVRPYQLGRLQGTGELAITAATDTQLLVVSAEAINEPIARHGPFVMNTKQELYQAFEDYQNGKF